MWLLVCLTHTSSDLRIFFDTYNRNFGLYVTASSESFVKNFQMAPAMTRQLLPVYGTFLASQPHRKWCGCAWTSLRSCSLLIGCCMLPWERRLSMAKKKINKKNTLTWIFPDLIGSHKRRPPIKMQLWEEVSQSAGRWSGLEPPPPQPYGRVLGVLVCVVNRFGLGADVTLPRFDRLEWRLCWKAAERSKKNSWDDSDIMMLTVRSQLWEGQPLNRMWLECQESMKVCCCHHRRLLRGLPKPSCSLSDRNIEKQFFFLWFPLYIQYLTSIHHPFITNNTSLI